MTDASIDRAALDAAAGALVDAGRALVDAGLSPGSSGNLSMRVGDRIVMTGTGASLGALDAASLSTLDAHGTLLEGARASKEVPLHLGTYARDERHAAVVHVHSPYAVALSCLEPWSDESAIPPLTPYVLMRVGQVPLLPFAAPGDAALGALVAACPHPFRGALLANHGAIVAGDDLPTAVAAAIEVEEACRVAVLTAGAGAGRRLIAPEQVRAIADRWGMPWTGSYGRPRAARS